MLHRIASALILSAAFTLSGPALANQPQGDGHCPINVGSDPDCAAEGAQTLSKSSRDEFPRCRNWESGSPRPAGCRKAQTAPATLLAGRESDKRDQFPTTTPQPGHLG